SKSGVLALFVLGCIGFACLFFLLMPVGGHPPEVWRRTGSKNKLKQLGLAMHNYHDKHNVFPPAMIVNETGYEMHGWPALLLPFLEQETLHGGIDFNLPFDEPANQSVMNVDVEAYVNPMVEQAPGAIAELHYALNSQVFGPNSKTSFINITDGFSNTFMGGEIAEGFRPWNNPRHTRDPALGFNRGYKTFGSPYFGTKYGGRVQMLMMDGAVYSIDDTVSPSILEALATPAGGETVSLP
ncbi:MAG TPA: DUF1559 domain-containing protein, partial [Planctomycetaceae bacterium]|nr:DUF1559 domain-containing protein [Planctomycetaceae bacterium]